jgi:hypothetical protein
MAELPQVPRAAEILGPGLDKLRQVRASAFAFANNGVGRWADLFAGWEGQIALLLRRLSDEVRCSRLPLASGLGLSDLAASEYETPRSCAQTTAVGEVTLGRGPTPATGGVIPKGFRFRRDADDTAMPPVVGAQYLSTQDVSWPLATAQIVVPIRATRAGAYANAPWIDQPSTASAPAGTLQLGDVPFDSTIAVVTYNAAGGSDGEDDGDLRRQAAAYALGQYAPTSGAIQAGALRGTGVHRLATKDVAVAYDGSGNAVPAAFTSVTIADASWASSRLWVASVKQTIATSFLGHGCAVQVAGVTNTRIRCALTVTLRDPTSLAEPSGVTAAIQQTLTSYFDDRPDWWTWKLAQIRAVVSRADPRILVCTQASVLSLLSDAVLPEPALPVAKLDGFTLTHWMLVSQGVNVIYQTLN